MTKVVTYLATDQTNGRSYVGSTTTSFERRKREHLRCRANDPFHNALQKRPESFTWEILSVEEENPVVRAHEQTCLDLMHGSKYCYNINPNANGFTSEQASAIAKKQWEDEDFSSMMGEVVSSSNKRRWEDEEYKQFMSEVVKRKWEDEEYRQSRSILSKETANRLWNDPEYREKHREGMKKHWESKENRVSASKRNREINTQKKRIEVVDTRTGERLEFDSVSEAGDFFGTHGSNFGRVARGLRTRYKNFLARFI